MECKLKLAENNRRLAEYHDDDEEEMNDVNLLLKEVYRRSYEGTMTIGGVMIAFGTGILGYFGGNVMTIKDITTGGEIGVLGCYVGLFMSK